MRSDAHPIRTSALALFIRLGVALFLTFGANASYSEGGLFGKDRTARQLQEETLDYHGDERSYLIYVPPNYRPEAATPLVLVLHGGFGNAEMMVDITGFDELAEKRNFVVVYPNGSGRRFGEHYTWNAGNCCGYAQEKGVDDVGFIKALLDRLESRFNIDRKRVYATGVSNGGMLAYRLACEIPERFAAIAPVAATLAVERCNPDELIPILHIHGTGDENVPYTGGRGSNTKTRGVEHRSVPDTLRIMRTLHQCSGQDKQRMLNADVEEDIPSCRRGGPVDLVLIKGGGHTWPGRQDEPKEKIFDGGISASKLILQFFALHPRDGR